MSAMRSWTVERITPAIGAELRGLRAVDLHDDEAADELHRRLIEHQVLVLPDIDVGVDELLGVAHCLGPAAPRHHEYSVHPNSDEIVVLEWGGERKPDAAEWHSDMTYRPEPPFASVLQAVVVPPAGGDTLWASMYSAFDALPSGMQRELMALDAFHDMGAFRTPAYRNGGLDGLSDAMTAAGSAVHPVVAIHPVTQRPYLNVSESFTRFIVGLSAPESARLLTMLFDQINRPEHSMRIRWRPGTIAIWDNRATQHYAVADYLPHRRVMHRATVATDPRSAVVLQPGAAVG